MTQVAYRESFGQRLRADLEECDVSIRELGRRLSPTHPHAGRRLVHKYLVDAHAPRESTRRRIALALGFDAERYL